MAGLLITFEGPEGAGKTTQIQLLARLLESLQIPVRILREPGGTKLGENIRSILLDPDQEICSVSEVLLYAAARAQLVKRIIRPALAAGEVVLCDRYVDASIAYQGSGRNLGADRVKEVNRIALDGVWPDLTILLDIAPEVGLARAQSRQNSLDRIESERIEFHQAVRAGYLALAKEEQERFLVIDAGESSPESIAQTIAYRVKEVLSGTRG